MTKITLFSQIIKRLDRQVFIYIVKLKGTDKHSKREQQIAHGIGL